MSEWVREKWAPMRPGQNWLALISPTSCINLTVLKKFDRGFQLADGYCFGGTRPTDSTIVNHLTHYRYNGELVEQTGAFIYRFIRGEETLEVLMLAAHVHDDPRDCSIVCVAAVPETFVLAWKDFTNECYRLDTALEPSKKVVIIGGRSASFVPTVRWDEIVLPTELKTNLLDDVSSFFAKGIRIYQRLNLKPFRKLLLAGVPGTGKTMLCSALANWAIDQGYLVIYVSSAQRRQDEGYGSSFGKIEHALRVAANSAYPSLILLEELDAYLHPEEKALVLNVLDGNESSINDKGTLLVATTNYPEAVDERIMKRPGRLDRIFIIPETRVPADAERMLRQYLGGMWREEHAALVPQLVGYPGAFIREVAVHALTQCAYDDLFELSFDLLECSFQGLKEQLDARDIFLSQRMNGAATNGGKVWGLAPTTLGPS